MKRSPCKKIVVILLIALNIILVTLQIYATNDNLPKISFSNNKIITEDGRTYQLLIKEDLSEYNEKYRNIDNFIFNLRNSTLPSKYDLRNEININVYDQGKTNNCWIYGTNSVLETTNAKAKRKNTTYDVEYTDKESSKIYNREENAGGTPLTALEFYTNGYGPLSTDTKKVDTQIGDFTYLASIYKGKDSNGNIKYIGDYTEGQVLTMRDKIKQHIKDYGAVTGCIHATTKQYFNFNSTTGECAYYCDYNYSSLFNTTLADHQITIIGWDDNYSKENFNPQHKPKEDGAYIALNSWGKDVFTKDGCFYISYEDTYIESCVYGVYNIQDKEYSTLYQNDELGMYNGLTGSFNYGANIFTRTNTSKPEILTQVSVANVIDSSYEIYVNPSSENLDFNKLIKVATTQVLSTGFHTIELKEPIMLTGSKFAVVVKYINNINGKTYFGTEFKCPNTVFSTAKINKGESYVYFEPNKQWVDLTEIASEAKNEIEYLCNLSIKAFAEEYQDKVAPTITNITMAPEEWTNGKVILSINGAKDNYSATEELQYSFDGGKTWQKSSSKEYYEITRDIEIWVKDTNDNIYKHTEKINVTKIDKSVPTLELSIKTMVSKLSAIIIIKANDEENGSGIKSITVNGENIATINNEIEYKTNTNGKYTIITTDRAGNKTIRDIEVTGIDFTINSDIYRINNNYIYKIPINTTKEAFLRNITINLNNKDIYEGTNKVENSQNLKTGMLFVITEEGETITYKLAITGDCNEDGKADINDIFQINKHRLKKVELVEEKELAADVNYDNNVNITDIFQLNKYRLGVIKTL